MRVSKFPLICAIALPFSRQIANGNAGPESALILKSLVVFLLEFFKYWSDVQTESESKFYLGAKRSIGVIVFR